MEIVIVAKVCLLMSKTTIYFEPDERVKASRRFLSLVFKAI